MSVTWSSRTVPGDAQVKDTAGLFFGCVVTPFDDIPPNPAAQGPQPEPPLAKAVGRCSSCGAYLNPYCKFVCDRNRTPKSWMCSVCGEENTKVPARYDDVANGK